MFKTTGLEASESRMAVLRKPPASPSISTGPIQEENHSREFPKPYFHVCECIWRLHRIRTASSRRDRAGVEQNGIVGPARSDRIEWGEQR